MQNDRDIFDKNRILGLIHAEDERQQRFLSLIASENHCSSQIRQALGSRLTDKYAEGYPAHRYYNGCEVVDEIEDLAIKAACRIFQCKFANVQPHSGSQANEAAYLAFLKPGDSILSLDLSHGGHLTHGYHANMSGKIYHAHHYKTDSDGIIDMDHVADVARKVKPKMIIAGASTYSRLINWAEFGSIAKDCGAILLADIAHFAGLIAGGVYPSPLPYADVVTASTHKVMRGPRGGMMLWDNYEYTRKLNLAVFPGSQGGPQMHSIAGKAICFMEADTREYQEYCAQVVSNARVFAEEMMNRGIKIVSGGTDCHMFTLDLREFNKNLTGREAADRLMQSKIITNKQLVPGDARSAAEGSGVRIGVAAITSRGFRENDVRILAAMVYDILAGDMDCSKQVESLCENFPLV